MTLKKEIVTHPSLGNIIITYNPKARRITMRARNNGIYVTMPPYTSRKELERALEIHKDKLSEQQKANKQAIIDIDYCIDAPFFKFKLQSVSQKQFMLKRYDSNTYTLLCPTSVALDDKKRQEWLRKVITESLRHRAKELLPARLKELAATKGFHYGNISIRDSHTRWGSCNNKKDISLSIYLVLLPAILIDYVIMHELCHTIEMNHSPRFWSLLDKATLSDSKKLRQQLKKFKTQF